MAQTQTLDLFSQNLFTASALDTISFASIERALERDKFACIRGLVSADSIKHSRQQLCQQFSRCHDHPTIGESPDDVKRNFQKLAVGSVHGKSHQGRYARLLRTFYNPLWAEDIYAMHDIFEVMITVRNRLLGKPDHFAQDTVDEGLWTAARIHQYPTGGGFMGIHRDKTLANVSRQANLNYFQILLIMTQAGVDFERGGGFIEHNGQRTVFEQHCQLGDLIIYDSQTLHGVEEIDPHQLLDLERPTGRLAAFVSLYKSL
ncbi:MAG: hypothetical protein AAFN18_17320 [Cyanobacteria bacterium J06554_6]